MKQSLKEGVLRPRGGHVFRSGAPLTKLILPGFSALALACYTSARGLAPHCAPPDGPAAIVDLSVGSLYASINPTSGEVTSKTSTPRTSGEPP